MYYLINRKQYTEIEDITSEMLPIQIGVPQGSIIGPILFIIYVNDFSQYSDTFYFIIRLVNLRFDPKQIATKRFLSEISFIGCTN